MELLFTMVVPLTISGVALYGVGRQVDVYSALIHGAEEGLETLLRIVPALVGLLTAVSMLRASGALDLAAQLLSPLLDRVGVPSELLPLMLVRPISGSAALGVGADLINAYGPDSALGRTAAVMLGCSIGGDTTYGQLFGGLASLEEVMAAPDHLEAERQVRDRCLELLMAPFDREQQGGVLAVLHDVTEQRKNQELQREFVANVSHELRTPLTNIRSYAETLSDSAGDIPPAMEKKFLGVILGESDRMTHIVQDLLTLSRFDSGRDDLKLARFSFEAAVQDLYNAVYMEAQRHSHTLELELEQSLPEVTADRERIVQVMMNIVSNAIKYTPDGGKIVISAGRTGERVWMQVDDNGIGIPPEDRPRIFERFYRVDKARSRQSGGTGLGLSIAKEIVARHEGVLELVDREGPGLSVRMELKIEGPSHD